METAPSRKPFQSLLTALHDLVIDSSGAQGAAALRVEQFLNVLYNKLPQEFSLVTPAAICGFKATTVTVKKSSRALISEELCGGRT